MSLTVALSKGKLLPGTEGLFRRAGLRFPDGEGRRLVVESGALRFLFVRDMDVPTYVEYGVADCGVAGRDVLLETGADVLEPLDLAFGRCRLVVASPAGSGFAPDRSATTRVASKYARVAAAHFLGRGLAVEVVRLAGSVEIAPGLGLADCIVDVVETGRTLAENGLEVIEIVAQSSARLIVNRASFHARREEVQVLVETLRSAAVDGPRAALEGRP
jgi:ATP phosphoribosyltransferase